MGETSVDSKMDDTPSRYTQYNNNRLMELGEQVYRGASPSKVLSRPSLKPIEDYLGHSVRSGFEKIDSAQPQTPLPGQYNSNQSV